MLIIIQIAANELIKIISDKLKYFEFESLLFLKNIQNINYQLIDDTGKFTKNITISQEPKYD